MGLIFLNIVDHINKRTYLVRDVPATYDLVPDYVKDNEGTAPIYEPHPGEMVRCRVTIAHMAEMLFMNIPFAFTYEGDAFDIKMRLEMYFEYLNGITSRDPAHNEFVRRTRELYKAVCKCCNRMLRKYHGIQPKKTSPLGQLLEDRSR